MTECRFIGAAEETHLKRLEDVFGAVLVCLFCRKLCFLKLQKLTPKNLQIRKGMKKFIISFIIIIIILLLCWSKGPHQTHLNLFIAGGELPLLKDEDVVSDPLQQHGDQLIILLPTQLQLLKHRHRQQFKFNNWRINFS